MTSITQDLSGYFILQHSLLGDPEQWQKRVTAVTIHISKHESALPEQRHHQLASPPTSRPPAFSFLNSKTVATS